MPNSGGCLPNTRSDATSQEVRDVRNTRRKVSGTGAVLDVGYSVHAAYAAGHPVWPMLLVPGQKAL